MKLERSIQSLYVRFDDQLMISLLLLHLFIGRLGHEAENRNGYQDGWYNFAGQRKILLFLVFKVHKRLSVVHKI